MCRELKGRITLSRSESEIVLHRLGFYVFGSSTASILEGSGNIKR